MVEDQPTDGRKTSDRIRARIQAAGARFHANDSIAEFIEPGEVDDLMGEVAEGMERILSSLVIDTDNDHNTRDTAKRVAKMYFCLLYTSPSPRDQRGSRMPSSA